MNICALIPPPPSMFTLCINTPNRICMPLNPVIIVNNPPCPYNLFQNIRRRPHTKRIYQIIPPPVLQSQKLKQYFIYLFLFKYKLIILTLRRHCLFDFCVSLFSDRPRACKRSFLVSQTSIFGDF